jgi:hypothetical protein
MSFVFCFCDLIFQRYECNPIVQHKGENKIEKRFAIFAKSHLAISKSYNLEQKKSAIAGT